MKIQSMKGDLLNNAVAQVRNLDGILRNEKIDYYSHRCADRNVYTLCRQQHGARS